MVVVVVVWAAPWPGDRDAAAVVQLVPTGGRRGRVFHLRDPCLQVPQQLRARRPAEWDV